MESQALVFFDGVCNLCNGAVRFIIDRDPASQFRFASLQGEQARRLLADDRDSPELSTIVLIEDGKRYARSGAALRIARRLSGGWPLLYLFIAVPRPLRDVVYDWVARNRYRWFGRTDACHVPTPAERLRFVDDQP